jgi:peptide/nickel transport system permease protein
MSSPTRQAFKYWLRKPAGVVAGLYLLLISLLALFSPWLSMDPSPNANRQCLPCKLAAPGQEIQFAVLQRDSLCKGNLIDGYPDKGPSIPFHSKTETKGGTLYRFHGYSGTSSEWISAQEKVEIHSRRFILGADPLGRDLWSRLLRGGRISLGIGWLSVMVALVIGLAVGALAGFFGGKVDAVLSFIVNLTWSVPTLLLVMTITIALGKGWLPTFLAVGLSTWVDIARVSRAEIIGLKKRDFALAGKALGIPTWRLIWRHILPGIRGPLLVVSAANFAGAVLIESGLSFLGLGVQPPAPTWGNMMESHRHFLVSGNLHLILVPGLAILSVVLAFIVLGDSLKTLRNL